jgi:hypothetical protein
MLLWSIGSKKSCLTRPCEADCRTSGQQKHGELRTSHGKQEYLEMSAAFSGQFAFGLISRGGAAFRSRYANRTEGPIRRQLRIGDALVPPPRHEIYFADFESPKAY